MTTSKQIRCVVAVGVFCGLLVSPGLRAQSSQEAGPPFPWAGQDAAVTVPDTVPPPNVTHNPRDLTGVWLRRGRQGLSDDPPPAMTPAGEALFRQSIVAVSSDTGPGVPPSAGNDPIMQCDPWGFPRVMWDFGAPMEFAHLSNRIVQFFEWTHVWRDIWMDGRSLPKDPDPRWMGYSIGRWEADTLVVETVGLDERAWFDEEGHRLSGTARFVERYRHPTATTLEYDATLYDAEYYTEPWVGTTREFRLLPIEGWPQAELREEFCAPSVELDFNQTIRDPAGGKAAP